MTTLKVPTGHWGNLGSFLTLPKCAGWKDSDLQWPGCQSFQKVLVAFDKRVSINKVSPKLGVWGSESLSEDGAILGPCSLSLV